MVRDAIWTSLFSLGMAVGGNLLAQSTAAIDTNGLASIVGNLGAVGAVILLFWHTQTKVIPALQASSEKTAAEFRLQLGTIMADNRSEISKIASEHRLEMAAIRDWHERAIVRMDANFTSLNGTIQAFLKAQEIGREQAVSRLMTAIQDRSGDAD